MPADPTPLDYEEPFVWEEWGVALPSGESARLLNEELARLMAEKNDKAILIKRTVTYEPWVVVAKRSRDWGLSSGM